MGSPPDEAHRRMDEGPQREVQFAAFWMGRHEVTGEEFEAWKPRKARTVPANSARSDLQQLIDAITRATPPLHSHVLWHGQGKPPRRLNNPARSQNVLHVAERQDRTLLSLANRS